MTKVQIPSTIKEATSALVGLEDLITAKEWHRAAIVYAFTYETKGGRPSETGGKPHRFSCTEFAARGIHGLRDKLTVSIYRAKWQEAIDQGHAEEVGPGDRVQLPEIPWPGRGEGTTASNGSGSGTIRSAISLTRKDPEAAKQLLAGISPAAIAKAVEEDPNLARAIARNDEALEAVETQGIEHRGRHVPDDLGETNPARFGRAVGNSMNKALGGGDLATEELNGAARLIMQAMVWAEEHGIGDEEAEAKAIARIKKNLRIYEQKADVTDTDREWAESQGITL